MRIQRKKRRTRILPPLASMGDIAFLLIIFFMLASQPAKESHVQVERPTASGLEDLGTPPVWVTVDAEGSIWVDGGEVSRDGLRGMVEALLAGREDREVLLKIDRHLLKEHYESLLIELSLAGASISLAGDEGPAP